MKQWITQGFDSFRRGTFGSGGQNLYVSRSGVLQRIYQNDLNRNGYFDLVFANCQNHHEAAESYVYTYGGNRTDLPGQGAVSGMAADLTGSGFQDLIVTGYYDMAAPYATTDIYFSGPDGYSENRHIRIPTPWAEDCCHGDFTGCGRQSLAFAQPNYRTVRIFSQTELGLEWDHYQDFPIEAGLIAAADLDGDGCDELIIRKKDATETTVYWGGPQGISLQNRTVLPELPPDELLLPEEEKSLQSNLEKKFTAPRLLQTLQIRGKHCFTLSTGRKVLFYTSDSSRVLQQLLAVDIPMALAVAAGDISGRGFTDLAFACQVRNPENIARQCSFIYWGNKSGTYSADRRQAVSTCQACDAAVLSRAERSDVLFVQSSAGRTYTNVSRLFSRLGSGPLQHIRDFIGEDSRRGFLIQNPASEPLIFLVNHYSRSSVGFDRSYVYWGSADGYSPERRLEVPSWCAVDSLCADLDDDGWAELLIANNSENSLDLDPGHLIHHFGPEGFQPEKTCRLQTDLGWGVVAGDFNHDGYLEIVTPCNHWQDLRIFYGRDHFEKWDTISLGGKGSPRWICAADFNCDGWLDLAVPLISSSRSLILWGGEKGFSLERSRELAVFHGVSATAADLSGNGYPDLIIGGHTQTPKCGELPPHNPHHSYIHIYWNGPEGFSESRKCILRADAACSFAVADFNNDGWLDIFAGSYHGGIDRDINSFIYWNRKGAFHELDRQLLFTHSASGCIAADFNEDGFTDLAVANHKVDGDHKGFSSVWWNGPEGFNEARRTDLPTCGPHGMTSVNPGNILTRKPEEFYESCPRQADSDGRIRTAEIDADIPPKTWVNLQMRSAPSEKELPNRPWIRPEDLIFKAGDVLQYRLAIGAVNALRTPRITRVAITFTKTGKDL